MPSALDVCAELRFTTGPSTFEIAMRSLGATGAPALPVSVYNFVLSTGAAAVSTPVSTDVAPEAAGGATVSDTTPWNVYDTGDLLFLSAVSNLGVGGCASGTPVGGFGQAVTTCGAGQFAVFRFAPTLAFDPDRFEILNLEAVALTAALPAGSCGASGAACRIVADTRATAVVPEPSVVVLTAAGLVALIGLATGRRRPA